MWNRPGAAVLLEVAFVEDPARRAVLHDKRFVATVASLPRGESDFSGQVGDPARDVAVVLDQEFAIPGVDVESVDVVQCGVAVVDAHDDAVRRGFGHRVDECPHAFDGREIAGIRHAGRFVDLASGIDGMDVVVLVAALVLDVEHVAAVLRPEIATHRTFGVGGDRPGGIERRVEGLHPDVHDAVVGFAEGNPLAVRRDLGAGDLGIAEEDLPVDQRRQAGQTTLDGVVLWLLCLGCHGRDGEDCHQRVPDVLDDSHLP